MVHCNPAPPHPPPGELYAVMCIDWGLLLTLMVIAAVVVFFEFIRLRQVGETK